MLAVLVLLRSRRAPAAVLACALVPGVLATDLARHDYSQQNPHQPAANWDPAEDDLPERRPRPRASCWSARGRGPDPLRDARDDFTLRKQLRFGRSPRSRDLLLDMAATRYGLEDVAGYDPLQLLAYRDAIAASNGQPPSDRHFLWVERAPTRLLRRLGVRYYVARAQVGARPACRSCCARRTPRRARRPGAAARPRQPPGPHRRGAHRRARARSRRDRHARRARQAGSCSPIRPIRAGRSASTATGAVRASRTGSSAPSTCRPAAHRVEWRFEPRSVRLGLSSRWRRCAAAIAYFIYTRRRSRRSA